ncbi:MAG: UDP-glucose 4-epimerase GalE [Bacteroidia bacterium]|nr:UDP-glucose 4-epimerase GalE [Bacteroidia bacterium]
MQSIIVTGGAGYIGSHTIIELLNNTDLNVISVDNFSNSSSAAYEKIKQICSRSFETIELDLCDKQLLEKKLGSLENVVGIIHFAAYKSVPESVADPLLYYHNNNTSLINILEFCKIKGIQNFIFSSSCSVYGNADALPVTEKTPLAKAESPYAHTKQMGEEMIAFFCKANPSFRATLLRYFNPVGAHISGKIGEFPLNRPNNLVPIITQTAVGKNSLVVFGNDYPTRDGSCIRDYIHVSDIADAHVKALQNLIQKKGLEQCQLFNLGTGNGVSVLEAIASFEKVSGTKLKYTIGGRRAGDVVAVYANNTRAKEQLNWVPKYSLDDMMASAWKWQLNIEGSNNS